MQALSKPHYIFSFFKKIIFNWRIIALQHCVGFCHTSAGISHRYTYVPSLLNFPPTSHPILPLQTVKEHWVELPVLYRKFPLASIIHMVMSMFQQYFLNSSHPLLPLLYLHVLFSMSASLPLLYKQVHQYHLSTFHIYVLIYDICFFADLLHSV